MTAPGMKLPETPGVYIGKRRLGMKKLFRSAAEKKIAGVCGGIGEFADIDPTIVRLVFVVLGLATGFFPFLFGYLIAWIIVPVKI
jgi:phage shock protein C